MKKEIQSQTRPHRNDPGYVSERRFGEGHLTLYRGQQARTGGLFPNSTGEWLLIKYPEGWVLNFESRASARQAMLQLLARTGLWADFARENERVTGENVAREGLMRLIVDTRQEAQRLDAELALRITWEAAAKAMEAAMEATKRVPSADGKGYEDVPDHVLRLKAFAELRNTIVGRPVTRQVVVHTAQDEVAKALKARRSDPEYREAAKKFADWMDRNSAAGVHPCGEKGHGEGV